MSHSKLILGDHIEKGDILCEIRDPFGTGSPTVVRSPKEGIIVGKNNLPLVNEGEALFKLATFAKMEQAVQHLEGWHEQR